VSLILDPKKHLNVKLRIQTNGLLFEKYWPELKNIHTLVKEISVSCDACSENVYKIIRGGSWSLLKKNLRFIASERKRLNVPEFFINFVVQESNFREMKDFVTFGKRLGVSRVRFTLMRHMNQNMSMSDYLMRAVHLEQHPRHDEFLEYLRDSVFANPIVDFRDLMPLYRKVGMV
jgi:molybdenum cofactor biosynthesis enzyme MoaA